MSTSPPTAQSYHSDFALHTLGWKAFQDLCAQICEVSLHRTISIYREAQDGGQDAVFLLPRADGMTEGTIQCKFAGKADQRLKASDITNELSSIEHLVSEGRAHTYYLITSMGIDAPVAAQIRDILSSKGVKEPYVLGREWITSEIKKSARLRALVPRVYGLGDLSTIIDERSSSQTRALLEHLLPSLRVYVPTTAHRTAVRILSEHKIVLLLGPPAIGKSMLAAILSTMAIDSSQNELECFKCEGPIDMISHWSPAEKHRLFWIDDAFGSNQMRDDYVNSWIESMPKVRAAIEQGNHFILTSRTHIWNEATQRLGTRNHPLFSSKKAIVEVGNLSPEERQQILYNHIKAGQQSRDWRAKVKPHLPTMADEYDLYPEIARRLGDGHYTAGIINMPGDLLNFIHHPQSFLEETFKELAVAQQAAMTLVFLYRSKLPTTNFSGDEFGIVADKYGTTAAGIMQALNQLEGSFIVRRKEGNAEYWGFFHPTFADAVSSILSSRPDLVDLYLKGVKIETLMAEAVCEGARAVSDAVIIPSRCFDVLVERLLEAPNEESLNEQLFQFIDRRTPDNIARLIFEKSPSLLEREGAPYPWIEIGRQAKIIIHAKAHAMGLLPENARLDTCYKLFYAAIHSFDATFISNDSVMAMFQPRDIINLTIKLISMLDEEIPSKIDELASEADPDADIDYQFSDIESFVRELCSLSDAGTSTYDRLSYLEESIEKAKVAVEARKSNEEEESFFTRVPAAPAPIEQKARSIFSDIDE